VGDALLCVAPATGVSPLLSLRQAAATGRCYRSLLLEPLQSLLLVEPGCLSQAVRGGRAGYRSYKRPFDAAVRETYSELSSSVGRVVAECV
jgi:hypothetical protein